MQPMSEDIIRFEVPGQQCGWCHLSAPVARWKAHHDSGKVCPSCGYDHRPVVSVEITGASWGKEKGGEEE